MLAVEPGREDHGDLGGGFGSRSSRADFPGQETPLQVSLNRNEGPLYRQVVRDLEGRISSGELPHDTQLPSEAELSERYGVHRLTVRQALAELARIGLIRTVHGRGSFVAGPPVPYEVSPSKTASLTRLMAEQGLHLEQRLVGRDQDAPAEVAAVFGPGARIERFDQVRELDAEPWALTSTWLDLARFPDLAEEQWTGQESLYEALQRGYGVTMHRASVAFSAAGARTDEAAILRIAPGTPLLIVRGLNVDDAGRPVAVAEHRFHGDRVRFAVALH